MVLVHVLLALRARLAALMSFYGINVQRLAMLLGENPVSDNPRYLHQMTTLQHARVQREALTNGAQPPTGKRLRTQGEDVLGALDPS